VFYFWLMFSNRFRIINYEQHHPDKIWIDTLFMYLANLPLIWCNRRVKQKDFLYKINSELTNFPYELHQLVTSILRLKINPIMYTYMFKSETQSRRKTSRIFNSIQYSIQILCAGKYPYEVILYQRSLKFFLLSVSFRSTCICSSQSTYFVLWYHL